MKELSLREVQLGELEILKRLDSICREQGLKYFLYAGTMIGAVRHKAFIPWDDDIDVATPLGHRTDLLRPGPHSGRPVQLYLPVPEGFKEKKTGVIHTQFIISN